MYSPGSRRSHPSKASSSSGSSTSTAPAARSATARPAPAERVRGRAVGRTATTAALLLGLVAGGPALASGCGGGGGSGGGGGFVGATATGAVLDGRDEPAAGVRVTAREETTGATVGTSTVDDLGRLFVAGLTRGETFVLQVGDGRDEPALFFRLEVGAGGAFAPLGRPFFLPDLGSGAEDIVQSNAAVDQTVADDAKLSGVALVVPANTDVDFPNGTGPEVTLVGVAPDRLPFPLPLDLQTRLGVLVEPFGVEFQPAATIRFPNQDGLAAGADRDLFKMDDATGLWSQVGIVTVEPGGAFLEGGPVDTGALYAVADQTATTTVSGRVVGPGDTPVAGYSVSAGSAFDVTDAAGEFDIVGVNADDGRIVVRVTAPPERFQPELVTTAPLAPVPNGTTNAGDIDVAATPRDLIQPTPQFNPADGANNVNETTAITISFNEAIATDTIGFSLNGATNGPVQGVIVPAADRESFTFQPLEQLGSDEQFSIVLSTAITDVSGNPIDDSVIVSQFTTRANGGAPSADVVILGTAPFEASAGDTVSIFGRNFPGASAVTVGGVAANVVLEGADEIRFQVPNDAPAGDTAVAVSTTTDAGATVNLRVFGAFAANAPSVATRDGNAVVTITGDNVGQVDQVLFDGHPAAAINVIDANTVEATVPDGVESGPVFVRQAGAAEPVAGHGFLVVND